MKLNSKFGIDTVTISAVFRLIPEDRVPDAKTIKLFREPLTNAWIFKELFYEFGVQLQLKLCFDRRFVASAERCRFLTLPSLCQASGFGRKPYRLDTQRHLFLPGMFLQYGVFSALFSGYRPCQSRIDEHSS